MRRNILQRECRCLRPSGVVSQELTHVDNPDARRDLKKFCSGVPCMSSADKVRETEMRARSAKCHGHAIFATLLGFVCLLAGRCAQAQSLNSLVRLDIQPQTLDKALLEFAREAHLQIMFATKVTKRYRTEGLRGEFTERQALLDLLAHSELRFLQSGNTIKIVPYRDHAGKSADDNGASGVGFAAVRRARARHPDSARALPTSAARKDAEVRPTRHVPLLEEVTVTGTHIAGAAPQSSPIITITRRQIQESGYQTVEQLMDSLPENFASVGSAASGAFLSSDVNAGNIANGAAVNLLGLGVDSTLVLVNGHRLAPSGSSGAFTDVSVIPLSAIKRVDVMTDGASAIYGADAIGGVVNYILRSHEQGAETSVEYGSVTQGGLKTYRASQSAGVNWSTGNAFFAYEFQKQLPLRAIDRPFTSSLGPSWDLLPGLTQNTLYATATNSLRNSNVNGDAFVSTRSGNYSAAVVGGVAVPYRVDTRSTQYSFGVGLSTEISDAWLAKLRASYGGNDTHLSDMYGLTAARSTLMTLSGNVSGTVIRLPSGKVKAAFGGQLRREGFSRHYGGAFTPLGAITKTRTVGALFAETSIPLVSAKNGYLRAPALALDLAARYEHYSDFGSSFNPRAGIAWKVVRELRVRGTVSTSFKPPNFYELYGSQYAALENAPDIYSSAGVAPIVEVGGSNPDLKAEQSTEWTGGFDIAPKSVGGLQIHGTYFQIRFRNRIASPNVPYADVFAPNSPYAPFIQENPSLTELDAVTQAPTQYANDTTYPGLGPPATLADAVEILNNRLQNVGLTRVTGVDDTVSYVTNVRGVGYHAALNTVYLLQYQNVPVRGLTPINVLSTLENPVNFRGRVTAGIEKGRWSLNGAVNYVNHYSDPTGPIPVRIASWTTVDMQMAYRLSSGRLGLNGFQVAVSCTNCLNRSPPSVNTASYLFGYDPTNASPMGRFVSLTLRKLW